MPRSRAGPSKQALARIQRLCCLGVGGEALMPELVREVAWLVPSRVGSFWWLGPNFEVTNICSTFPQWFRELWRREYQGTDRELEVFRPFGEQMTCPSPSDVQPLGEMLCVDRRDYLRSNWYNLLLRPAEVCDYLRLRVREAGR
ncbi:MAG: hypothetical protein JOY65_08305, partial [Acetobacteraceae bacterium]|nr:hypothetical protein [Acetobacteraceae bacterium]